MPVYTFTWHAVGDDRTCKICKAINGYIWTFDTAKGDIMTDALWHPQYGIVWSLSEGSNAHGYHHKYNCRCKLEEHVNLEDVLAKSTYLAEIIKDLLNEVDDTKGGNTRKTTFEDIGIDPSKYGF